MAHEDNVIEEVDREEMHELMMQELREEAKIAKMSPEERFRVCDMGYLNDSIRGYMVLAMRDAGCSEKEICQAAECLHYIFDEVNAAEAAKVRVKK